MHDRQVLIGALLEDACLTLEQLCSACAVSPEWVASHVSEGRVRPTGDRPSQWRFGSRDLWRVRQIRHFEIAFDAEPELAALVADLLEELDNLRAQLRRIGPG
ncbi:MAG TPA: chaperone modulator CbpM [Burkholderiaceae bacterium]|jgi:chaperone modulatory protein CbpM|nr:chaperone modulator CbpM [Burkholderiaceae bacterium]